MKKKIRRKEWLLLAGMLTVGMMAGCGAAGTREESNENVAKETETDVETEEETIEENGQRLGDREQSGWDEFSE